MAAMNTISMLDSNLDVDKLSYEIFSILENKFLFGYNEKKISSSFEEKKPNKITSGKVRILSIDGAGSTSGIFAAKSLCQLEAFLRVKSGNPKAHISHYFDVVVGSGAGGVLASLLFSVGKTRSPLFTAKEALNYMQKLSKSSFFKGIFSKKSFIKTFGDITLKDTLKSVLVPCFDLNTGAPFLFSRADAVENDGYDFKMKDVCAATMAAGRVNILSIDRHTNISAVGGALAMNNPTAAAMTHVMNNKQEFPFCNSVEDLLVVSLGNGDSNSITKNTTPSTTTLLKIAGDGASDMVDQAVSMAFGECRTNNYIRIQATKKKTNTTIHEMLAQNNIESVLFEGRKLSGSTNMERLEFSAGELIKEHERRKSSILPTVVLKHATGSPRTSSATSLSTMSSN